MDAGNEREREQRDPAPSEQPEKPRELFRRVQKRDGSIVDFDREKITEAIWAAARSVGGKSRETAETLTDRVILHLARFHDDHLLTIEEVQDAVEKVLIEQGHARTSKAFILYRHQRERERGLEKKPASIPEQQTLFETGPVEIREGDGRIRWDRGQVVEALLRETSIPRKFAEQIGREIESQIINARMHVVTLPLIRELVNCKLVEYGLEVERKTHTRLGLPLGQVERILSGRREVPPGEVLSPRVAERTLAGEINRQYAFLSLLPPDASGAHMGGEIFIHGLSRLGCLFHGVHSADYLKCFGMDSPAFAYREGPARSAEALIRQMGRMRQAGRSYFLAGSSWPFLNVLLAPLFEPLQEKEHRQEITQFLCASGNSPEAFEEGAPVDYADLYWSMPEPLGERPAILGGGVNAQRPYESYTPTARSLLKTIIETCSHGDGRGQPIRCLEPRIQITPNLWKSETRAELWKILIQAIQEDATFSIVLQRGGSLHFPGCLRLSLGEGDRSRRDLAYPWKIRYASWGKISINLPRLVTGANGLENEIAERLGSLFESVAGAIDALRGYGERLFHEGSRGPLGLLGVRRDGEPYLRRGSFLVGIHGLDVAARLAVGRPEASDEELSEAERWMIERLYVLSRRYGKEMGLPILLTECRESAAHEHFRKALPQTEHREEKRDARQLLLFSDGGEPPRTETDPARSIRQGGQFHDFYEGGACIPISPRDFPRDPLDLESFLYYCYQDTRALGIRIQGADTFCEDCGITARGAHELCPFCHSANVQ